MNQIIFRLALTLIASLISSQSIFADIQMSFTRTKSMVGATGARTVGDRILLAEDAKPSIVNAVIIKVTSDEKVRVFARKTLDEKVVPIKLPDADETDLVTEYLLVGEGKYTVESHSGSYDGELKLELDPAPVDPIGPDLPPLSKEARTIVVGFVQALSSDMDSIAEDITTGKIKTVAEAATANQTLSTASRGTFNASMTKVMQPKLGSGPLPADASKTFSDIATGFKAVK